MIKVLCFNRRLCVFLLLLAITVSVTAQVSDNNEDGVMKVESRNPRLDFVPGQVLLKFKDEHRVQINRARGAYASTSVSQITDVLNKFGIVEMEKLLPNAKPLKQKSRTRAYSGDAIEDHDLSQLYCVKLADDHKQETMQLVDELNKLNEVEFAEPNFRVYIMVDDNIAAEYSSNPMVSQQWYLDAYGVKELWNKPVINKQRPVIAIIDTGVDITHPDLKDNIWTKDGTDDEHGYDFINNTTKMRDNNSHGTHVAGIAAAANNGVGIVGANPRALIMPITVLQSDGIGDNATLIKGIDYAVRNGATVLNMSIGTYGNSSALRQSLERAYQNAVIVAAAGNDHKCIYKTHNLIHIDTPMPCFPGAYSFVLGVQATTQSGSLATFSNYDDDGPLTSCESTQQDTDGFNYELKAPGTQILSSVPGGGYREYQGTSMSSPLVAGAISALLMVKKYDNQEILWGDLLHTNNIVEAYDVTARPAELDITRIVLRNRNEQDTDVLNDYDVNVGETIEIYPFIRTSFGSASNIKLNLTTSSGAEISTSNVDFGYNLDAFGKMTSKNPLIVKIPDEMPNASEIRITVQATCKESDKTFSSTFTLRVVNMYTLKGMLTEDMTLTPDHVYYVPGKFGVNVGTTLTIKPGTRVEFDKDAGIFGFGKLNIKGTPEAPIVFTPYNKSKAWSGIYSHAPSGLHEYDGIVYTNAEQTLFTLLPTEATPELMSTVWQNFYYDTEGPKTLYLKNYIDNWVTDMSGKVNLLTDPNYLTPAMLKMMDDWNGYFQRYPTEPTNEMRNSAYVCLSFPSWYRYTNPTDTITYCRIDGFSNSNGLYNHPPIFFDCISENATSLNGSKNVIISNGEVELRAVSTDYTNFVNLTLHLPYRLVKNGQYETPFLGKSNFINNYWTNSDNGKKYILEVVSSKPETLTYDYLPYLGTAREDFLRPLIYEYGNTDDWVNGATYATLDLSNIQKEPYKEAHGIVWKVLVNGKDAQDEQEDLLPLGVGRHKFEVYFNRPMNKTVTPLVSFGVISPYTQHPVSEDGSWNEAGTIYTAYATIDGKTQSDGMNRIYVRDAEDNEFFPCPYEATRFNIMIQAAGSMASGFQADAGLGCVKLKWNNENNDFEDAMGFNVYRYIQGENGANDTVRINQQILDITSTSYIDDDVEPGHTYYYYYKVLSTALQEYDVSNVVAATPLTATRGDANGSGNVDVADVVTTVNYITGYQPKPFVFDAADMNSDKLIDIFDVVGIIQGILDQSRLSISSSDEATATYTIENGTLYIESPVAIGGVQVQLSVAEGQEITVADDLDGFEQASSWLSDNDYLFLAYSLSGKYLESGKHTLLHFGEGEVTSIRISDTSGKNVTVNKDEGPATVIDIIGRNIMNGTGVFDLQGRKIFGNHEKGTLQHGVYIINGKKVVK